MRESGGGDGARVTGGLGGTQEISGAGAWWGSGRRVRSYENGETGSARAGANPGRHVRTSAACCEGLMGWEGERSWRGRVGE